MSSSFMALNSKYNTLYSLYLKLQNNMVTQDLSGVLNAGNTADNTLILTDGIQLTGLEKDKLSFYHNAVQELAYYGVNYARIQDATFQVNIANTGWAYEKGLLVSNIDEGKIQFVDNLDSTEGHLTKSDLKIISGVDQLLLDTTSGFTFSKQYLLPVPYTLSSYLSDSKLNIIDSNGYESVVESDRLQFKDSLSVVLAEYSNQIHFAYTGMSDLFEITPKIISNATEDGNGGGDMLRLEYLSTAGLPSLFNVTQNNTLTESTVNLQMYGESTTETWQSNLSNKLLDFTPSDTNQCAIQLGTVDGLLLQSSSGTIGMNPQNGLSINKIASNTVSPLDIISDTTFAGQASFNLAPHCIAPAVNGDDLVTLGYVNSLVGQYSGGYNFFFNYSVPDGIYQSLGQSVVDSVTQQIVPITTDTTNQLVAKFVSSALGITTIPSGIWNMLIYSEVASNGGTLTYYFEVYTLTGITETLLFTSASSADVNANTTPAGFNVNGTLITPATIALTDKIVVKIYLHKDGAPLLVNTYFQYDYYSFIQTTLNAGTTILSSNNTFTGSNSFTQPITIPIMAFPATVEAVNGSYLTTNYVDLSTTQSIIAGAKTFTTSVNVPTAVYPNNTSIAVNGTYLTSNYVNIASTQTINGAKTFSNAKTDFNLLSINGNQLNVLNSANTLYLGYTSTTGIINIGELQTSGVIQIGNDSRTGAINIGNGLSTTGAINIGANTGSSTITIGSATKPISMNGSSTFSQSLQYTGTALPISENSSNVPPTSWIVSYFLSIATAASTYLTIANATSTYLTIANATSTYLTTATASSTYLTIANAASTYLTTATAASTYVPIAGSTSISGQKTFSSSITQFNLLEMNGNQINSIDGTLPMNIGQSSSSGNINIGNAQTSGIIQIGNNASRTGASTISIGSGALSLSPINIGSSTGSATITIGSTSKVVNITSSDITLTGPTSITDPITLGIIAPTFPSQLGSSSFNNTATTVSPINVGNSRIASTTGVVLTQGVYLCSVNSGYSFTAGTVFTSGDYTIQNGMSQQANNLANIALVPLSQTSGSTRILCASSTTTIGANCCVLSSTVVLIVPIGGGTYFGSTYLFNTATTSTVMPKCWAQLVSIVRMG